MQVQFVLHAVHLKKVVYSYSSAEMYPECVIASWDALILLLDAENIE